MWRGSKNVVFLKCVPTSGTINSKPTAKYVRGIVYELPKLIMNAGKPPFIVRHVIVLNKYCFKIVLTN